MSKTELGKKSATGSTQVESLQQTQVPLGISLVYYSLVLMLLAIIGAILVSVALSGNPQVAGLTIAAMMLLIIVASVLSLVGTCLCLTAPIEMPGNGAIFLAVALNAVAIFIQVMGHFTTLHPLLGVIPSLLNIAGFVSFLDFLKHVGSFMRNNELKSQAEGVLKLGIALVVVMGLMVISAFVMPMAGALLGLLGFILGVVGFFRYVRLLHDLKQAFARG